MATCTELYIDTLGGLDLDGSTDKNLPYFVVENLATLPIFAATPHVQFYTVSQKKQDTILMSVTNVKLFKKILSLLDSVSHAHTVV